ncbi:hypothetical protein [Aeromicrobium sp.]|uniref:hypothetical protein n=1 Tax=Aeromicrobium sp. TaxID=1871063 RepID=UPI004034D911
MITDADTIIAALKSNAWTTADLVRIAHAVASMGKNTTSVLGQYGEELVAVAFDGVVEAFDQKAYDVRTREHGDLQVKTYSLGKRPGAIRSLTHDVVTVEVDPATAQVRRARLYKAADLHDRFRTLHAEKYAAKGLAWGGNQADRFERGWTIPSGVPFEDVTDRFDGLGQ